MKTFWGLLQKLLFTNSFEDNQMLEKEFGIRSRHIDLNRVAASHLWTRF